MKLMRLAVCAAVFALMGGIVLGEDVAALQAKLAAQEARLNDLQAKMNNVGVASCAAPEAITSLRKNATVTIGGNFSARYIYGASELKSKIADPADPVNANPILAANPMRGISTKNFGAARIGDAELQFQIDVNEYFDAYINLEFEGDGGNTENGVGQAKNYWIRWKNLCNTGFGILIGRDALKFGGIQSYGHWDSFGNGTGDASGDAFGGWGGAFGANDVNLFQGTDGMLGFGDSITPTHTIWNNSRTIQVTPYWESQDGKIKAELSWFQAIQNPGTGYEATRQDLRGDRIRSVNNGFGSFSARLGWKPIEGLNIMASVMNQKASNTSDGVWGFRGLSGHAVNAGIETNDNNFATNLAFEYRPCFFSRLNVFASWTHGWNEGWIKDQDSDSINYGLGIDLNESLTWYATGDYLRVSNDQSNDWNKANAWAAETGFMYNLPYGVQFKAAWRHDDIKFKGKNGLGTHTKYKSDMFVVQAGFQF